MRPRVVIVALGVVLCLVVLLVTWRRGEHPDERARAEGHHAGSAELSPAIAPSPRTGAPSSVRDAGTFAPPAATVHDRAARDEVRRRLFAAWAGQLAVEAGDVDAGDPLRAPMPTLDGGSVDPSYIRERIREDFVPMARACYEQLLARQPGVTGRAVAELVIVGDEGVGGVVDEVRVDTGDGGLAESGFDTCLRESMYTVAFRPPPGRGSLRVRYPFQFTPDPPDASR